MAIAARSRCVRANPCVKAAGSIRPAALNFYGSVTRLKYCSGILFANVANGKIGREILLVTGIQQQSLPPGPALRNQQEVLRLRNNHFMRNRFSKVVGAGAFLLAIGSGFHLTSRQAAATPATLGFYPATDIYPRGNFHLDVDSYGRAFRTNSSVTGGITYGIGPDTSNFLGRSEVGFDYVLNSGITPSTKRLLFNAKTQVFNNDTTGTRIVAGTWGVGNKAIAAPDVIYLLGSKSFSFGRIHLGVAQALASKSTVADGNGQADRTNLHVAYDRVINPKWTFVADWYSGKNNYSCMQPTIYYNVNPQASFGLGFCRFNSSALAIRNQTYLAFDYNFGPGAPK